MSSLHTELRRFIETNFLLSAQSSRVGNGDSLIEAGIMDSTGYLELIEHLEQRFAIRIADAEMTPDNLETLDRIVAFLVRRGVCALV